MPNCKVSYEDEKTGYANITALDLLLWLTGVVVGLVLITGVVYNEATKQRIEENASDSRAQTEVVSEQTEQATAK